jgi:uncharacterized OB-fold protein
LFVDISVKIISTAGGGSIGLVRTFVEIDIGVEFSGRVDLKTEEPVTEPIAEDLFTWPDPEPALIGGRCADCGHYTFPLRAGCPFCGGESVQRQRLGRQGTLWTWTTQGFLPKPPYAGQFADPDNFEPWYVGLVEIPGQLRVESVLVDCDENSLSIGMPMRLVVIPFRKAESGVDIVTFAFAPDAQQETSHA